MHAFPGGIFCKKKHNNGAKPSKIYDYWNLLQIFGETGARESATQCLIVILFSALDGQFGTYPGKKFKSNNLIQMYILAYSEVF